MSIEIRVRGVTYHGEFWEFLRMIADEFASNGRATTSERERRVWHMAESQVREWVIAFRDNTNCNNTPRADCMFCNRERIDGHLTCGDAGCPEQTARDIQVSRDALRKFPEQDRKSYQAQYEEALDALNARAHKRGNEQ